MSATRLLRQIHAPVEYGVQKRCESLQDVDRSAEVYRQAFTQPTKRYDTTSACAISRAKNGGSNPHATLKAHLRKHKKAGGTHEQALLLVADLAAFIDGLHGESMDCTDAAIRRANMVETEHEGAEENIAQMAAHECITKGTLERLRDGLTKSIAHEQKLLAKVNRRIELEGR